MDNNNKLTVQLAVSANGVLQTTDERDTLALRNVVLKLQTKTPHHQKNKQNLKCVYVKSMQGD